MSKLNNWRLQYALGSRASRNNSFQSKRFVLLGRLQFEVELIQSVSNQGLYVRKLLHRTADPDGEDSQHKDAEDHDEHNGFKYEFPPELRVSTCSRALARLPKEDYFPRLVGWQQWNGIK